jgi:hypothetical protein
MSFPVVIASLYELKRAVFKSINKKRDENCSLTKSFLEAVDYVAHVFFSQGL